MSGKKRQYTREMLDKIVEEVKTGASLRATSKKYNIPQTTLQGYKKKIYIYAHNTHTNSALTPEEELIS